MRKRLLVLIAAVLLIGAYFLFFFRSPVPAPVAPAPAPANDQAARTYSSGEFGISFQYDSTQVGVSPQGTSSIELYALGTGPDEGQRISRFNKPVNETLEQSIRRQILAGYATSTCTVVTTTLPNTYIKAEISYPVPENSPLGHEELCNASYDKTSGIRYFLYDPQHADRFYFVSIGQYPLPATKDTAWQDTISIR